MVTFGYSGLSLLNSFSQPAQTLFFNTKVSSNNMQWNSLEVLRLIVQKFQVALFKSHFEKRGILLLNLKRNFSDYTHHEVVWAK